MRRSPLEYLALFFPVLYLACVAYVIVYVIEMPRVQRVLAGIVHKVERWAETP